MMVGDTGFEPVTSSVSRKRATTAPIARDGPKTHPERGVEQSRWRRDLNPCRRICSPLPRLSATPPRRLRPLRADDEARTRDLNLGKVALYQLSYVRATHRWDRFAPPKVRENCSRHPLDDKFGQAAACCGRRHDVRSAP